MALVVGVQFKRAGKVYYFDPNGLEINKGVPVIVETARGLEYGQVVQGPKEIRDEEVTQPLKKVVRLGTNEDQAQLEENRQREKKAFKIGLEKIAAHNLDMKLIDVEYTFDRSKIIFYFTADGRVDFRELVKDLASVFRTRIELRQIGVRDEAKMIGGLGPCGRPLCCSTFLGDFEPVSIKMAKEQNLSLNPAKISGICSRLMCCLKYESEGYRMTKADLPQVGAKVRHLDMVGKVLEQYVMKETILIEFANGERKEVPLGEVEVIDEKAESREQEAPVPETPETEELD